MVLLMNLELWVTPPKVVQIRLITLKLTRFLSSNRAATVTVYLQEKNIVDPDRLVSVGYGQWRPIAGFNTSEERAQNRRVELMITGINPNNMESSVDQYFTTREGDAQAEE